MGKPLLRGEDAVRAVAEAPAHRVAEVLHGELHLSPRPRLRHGRVASRLGMWLGPFDEMTDGPGGWLILDEPQVHLGPGPDILVPDLAGWRREHMSELPDAAYTELAPDWVCEVLSPSTERIDREKKLPIYARESVRHVWLIDPAQEHLEAFELEGTTYRSVGAWRGDTPVRAAPFQAGELPLGQLWQR